MSALADIKKRKSKVLREIKKTLAVPITDKDSLIEIFKELEIYGEYFFQISENRDEDPLLFKTSSELREQIDSFLEDFYKQNIKPIQAPELLEREKDEIRAQINRVRVSINLMPLKEDGSPYSLDEFERSNYKEMYEQLLSEWKGEAQGIFSFVSKEGKWQGRKPKKKGKKPKKTRKLKKSTKKVPEKPPVVKKPTKKIGRKPKAKSVKKSKSSKKRRKVVKKPSLTEKPAKLTKSEQESAQKPELDSIIERILMKVNEGGSITYSEIRTLKKHLPKGEFIRVLEKIAENE